jgi:hypothetical protein
VWEESKILKVLYDGRRPATTRVNPSIHFALLIDYMKQDMPNYHCFDSTSDGPTSCATHQANP